MEKLEKHIKDNLGERKITPSPKAWDKISGQIDSTTPPRNEKKYWYAIAAGFIGLLLASLFFFASDKEDTKVELVDDNEIKTEIKSSTPALVESDPDSFESSTVKGADKKDVAIDNEKEEGIALGSTHIEDEEVVLRDPIKDSFLKESDTLIAQKASEVFAKVALLEDIHSEVSDAEVDSLLRAAQEEILNEQLFTPSGNVDAMALLTQVEDELDESFRDQIFEALKEGYFKLRTAVADRNN